MQRISKLLIFTFAFGSLIACKKALISESDIQTFSYNIPIAPQTFDPLLQQGTNSRYLLNHLYLTLYKWNPNNELTEYGAQNCAWTKNILKCDLKKGLKFQDGTPILAKHYVYSLNLIKQNQTKKILNFDDLKYKAINDYELEFEIGDEDYNFKHKLAFIEISPRKKPIYYKTAQSVVSSTNFIIETYNKNQNLTLKHKIKKQLKVQVYFLEDQSTALRMYESGKLDLLTLLPVREIARYQNSKDLFHIPMTRMDGLFFNSNISLEQKKILFHGLNLKDLKNLYLSEGMPGCPALPKSYYINDYCYDYDPNTKLQNKIENKSLKLSFSSLGGDDIQRGMEWFAHEWKKNLGLNIEIEPLESGLFFQRIKSKNFDIVRKGLSLDAPTCLEALTSFTSNDPNNVSEFKNKDFDQIFNTLKKENSKNKQRSKELCDKALNLLHKNYTFLPLGPMYFSFLQNHNFKGWTINSLNILDLENLTYNKLKN
jgi:ABC-type oligopeptide transport system substrate-binding subunit